MRTSDIKRQQEHALRAGRERDKQLRERVFAESRSQIEPIKERLISLGLTIGEPVCDHRTTLVHLWFAVPILGAGAQSEALFAAAGAVGLDASGRWVFFERCSDA